MPPKKVKSSPRVTKKSSRNISSIFERDNNSNNNIKNPVLTPIHEYFQGMTEGNIYKLEKSIYSYIGHIQPTYEELAKVYDKNPDILIFIQRAYISYYESMGRVEPIFKKESPNSDEDTRTMYQYMSNPDVYIPRHKDEVILYLYHLLTVPDDKKSKKSKKALSSYRENDSQKLYKGDYTINLNGFASDEERKEYVKKIMTPSGGNKVRKTRKNRKTLKK